jgi:hypothetical protein
MGIRWKLLCAFATIVVVYLSAAGPGAAQKLTIRGHTSRQTVARCTSRLRAVLVTLRCFKCI